MLTKSKKQRCATVPSMFCPIITVKQPGLGQKLNNSITSLKARKHSYELFLIRAITVDTSIII